MRPDMAADARRFAARGGRAPTAVEVLACMRPDMAADARRFVPGRRWAAGQGVGGQAGRVPAVTTFERAAAAVRPLDAGAMAEAAARQDRLTKPRGALGRLETLSVQLAGIAG